MEPACAGRPAPGLLRGFRTTLGQDVIRLRVAFDLATHTLEAKGGGGEHALT